MRNNWDNPLNIRGEELARFSDGTLCLVQLAGDCFYEGSVVLPSGLVDRTEGRTGYVRDWNREDVPIAHIETRIVI